MFLVSIWNNFFRCIPTKDPRSGSILKQGEAEGAVVATGANTFFNRAISLVGQDNDTTGHLQKILGSKQLRTRIL